MSNRISNDPMVVFGDKKMKAIRQQIVGDRLVVEYDDMTVSESQQAIVIISEWCEI